MIADIFIVNFVTVFLHAVVVNIVFVFVIVFVHVVVDIVINPGLECALLHVYLFTHLLILICQFI